MTDESIAFSVKRRRLISDDSACTLYALPCRSYKRKKRIWNLPDEILTYIIRKLPYKEVAKSVHNVCRRFKTVSTQLLNSAFCRIRLRLNTVRSLVTDKLQTEKNLEEISLWYRVLNLIEHLDQQYMIMRATMWRYNYFAEILGDKALALRTGILLDQFDLVFRMVKNKPTVRCFGRRGIPYEILRLKNEVKEFLVKFEKFVCDQRENDPFRTGAKIVDILDCFLGIDRKVVREKIDNNICNLKIEYIVDRAWFTVLSNGAGSEKRYHEDLRFMLKRLRRIVLAHNSVVIEEQMVIRQRSANVIVIPSVEMYSGYGEQGDKFYFYGTMSEGFLPNNLVAHLLDDTSSDGGGSDNDPDDGGYGEENEVEPVRNLISHRDISIVRPILRFDVTVTCPWHLAPLFIVERGSSCELSLPALINHHKPKPFNLTMVVYSSAAHENRLPYRYKYTMSQTNSTDFTIVGEDIN